MPKARETILFNLDESESKEVEIEFEVYCYNCNTGICKNTRYIKGTTNAFETYCEVCDKEHKKEKEKLEQDVAGWEGRTEDLERFVAELEERIAELEKKLEEL